MASNDVDLIGKQLGTCILEKVVGAGGMGKVFLARQTRPSRHVAVKLLMPPVGQHTDAYQEFLERFRREANVVAQLDHINILPIYGYDEQDNMAYLVMPYLDGGSLRTLLSERGALSPKEALTYLEQAASALQYAHDHNIVHRDIKPANMLFHADGRLVLVDFGIARIMHEGNNADISLTKTGNFMGSLEYMAPEMVQGANVDYRADIYELGIVLYRMLAGRLPFQGTTPYTLASKHIHEIPPPLMTINAELSPEINAVVQKALAKDPAVRYQSVREFAEAYRKVVSPSSALIERATDIYTHVPWPNTGQMPHDIGNTTMAGHAQQSYQQAWPTPTMTPQSNPYPYTVSATPYQANPVYQQSAVNRPAPTPLPVAPSRRFSVLPWLVVLMALCLIGVVGYLAFPSLIALRGHSPSPTPTQPIAQSHQTPTPGNTPTATATSGVTPTVSSSDAASSALNAYYNAINQQDYQTAYQLWDVNSNYRKQNSYSDFVHGFANTISDSVSITNATPQSDGTVRLQVTLQTTEKSGSGNVQNNYSGYYLMMNDGGSWLIIDAKILPA